MPTQCVLSFDNNPNGMFFAGELMSGRIRISLSKSKKIRGLSFAINGHGYCKWSTDDSSGDERRTQTHIGRETYLQDVSLLVGATTLQPGVHNYNFLCQLPIALPTSFEGKYGNIRYSVRIVMQIPFALDKTFEMPITIHKPWNFAMHPMFQAPLMRGTAKEYVPCSLFFCCSSGSVNVIARTPQTGYSPGQQVDLKIDVENESGYNCVIWAELVKLVDYKSDKSTRNHESMPIFKTAQLGLIVGGTSQTLNANFVLPSLSPTDEAPSQIIKVHYVLRVHATVNDFYKDAIIDLPIVIGSQPVVASHVHSSLLNNSMSPVQYPSPPQTSANTSSQSYQYDSQSQSQSHSYRSPLNPPQSMISAPPPYDESIRSNQDNTFKGTPLSIVPAKKPFYRRLAFN